MSKFEMKLEKDIVVFYVPDINESEVAQKVKKSLQELVERLGEEILYKGVVFDFAKKFMPNASFMREITSGIRQLRSKNLSTYVINTTRDSERLIRDLGMDGLFKVIEKLDDVFPASKEAPKAPSLNVEFVNPFIEGTIETLKIQCSLQILPGKIFLKGKGPSINIDISAVIGIISPQFSGSVAICFPAKTFLSIMNQMLGENYHEITAECEDGAAELLNIIFGFAKRELNVKGFGIEKAIPTIIRGKSIELKHAATEPTVVLPFDSSAGEFQIQIGLSQKPMELT